MGLYCMYIFETADVTDNQDIVISWYNMAGIERQMQRDKSALENLAEQ